MPMDLAVSISDLRKITNLIFDYMERDLRVSSVPIEEDYYWNIPSQGLYNVIQSPPAPDIGQLYHDWEFLQSILKDHDNAVPLMLTHVAPLLRFIGENVKQHRNADSSK